jgi:hypothetical protein
MQQAIGKEEDRQLNSSDRNGCNLHCRSQIQRLSQCLSTPYTSCRRVPYIRECGIRYPAGGHDGMSERVLEYPTYNRSTFHLSSITLHTPTMDANNGNINNTQCYLTLMIVQSNVGSAVQCNAMLLVR